MDALVGWIDCFRRWTDQAFREVDGGDVAEIGAKGSFAMAGGVQAAQCIKEWLPAEPCLHFQMERPVLKRTATFLTSLLQALEPVLKLWLRLDHQESERLGLDPSCLMVVGEFADQMANSFESWTSGSEVGGKREGDVFDAAMTVCHLVKQILHQKHAKNSEDQLKAG